MTFATTPVFLEYFGLRSLDDLPAADELRRIPVFKPEGLATVDPGLATAPPEQLAAAPEPPAGSTPAEQPQQEMTPQPPSQVDQDKPA
jgi:segregation and condensation protein B